MGDPDKWTVDSNSYYLTNYHYSPAIDTSNWPSDTPKPDDTSAKLYSEDSAPLYHTVTFESPANIKLKYAIGKMYAGPGVSPSAGLYYSYKTADGGNHSNAPITVDNLGEASEIDTVTSNPITLTEREIALENITELTIQTSGRPVLWVDYIQIEILE